MLCSAFVISDVNGVPAVADLSACCAGFVSFASIPTVLMALLLLSFLLLLHAILLLLEVMQPMLLL
jgi:hypothetical protein